MGACPQRGEFSERIERDSGLGFRIVRDTDNSAARAFGLVIPTPADVQEAEQFLGLDLPAHNATDHWDLPMPARYVIAQDGRVAFASVHPDHTRRSDPEEALAAVRSLG